MESTNQPKGKVRAAMVGAGSMANSVHYPSLASFPDVEIAAICDLDPVRLTTTADKYGVERRYADYQKMVEEIAPDAVYVIGPPFPMFPIWVWCLEHKLNLYIEKPMGTSIHQARMLAYLAEKHGNVTQVSFQRRSCPMVVELREECLKRGPITHAVSTFYKHYLRVNASSLDHMMNDGVHAIDTLRWLCGGEAVDVQSLTGRFAVPDTNGFAALVRFDSGSIGVVMLNHSTGRRVFRVEMHAPGISAEAEHEGKGYLYVGGDTKGVVYDTKEVADSEQNYVSGGFRAKNRNFIDCVKSGGKPESSFADALKTMEIAEKILAQSLLRGD